MYIISLSYLGWIVYRASYTTLNEDNLLAHHVYPVTLINYYLIQDYVSTYVYLPLYNLVDLLEGNAEVHVGDKIFCIGKS